jgi:hypothetical protein
MDHGTEENDMILAKKIKQLNACTIKAFASRGTCKI